MSLAALRWKILQDRPRLRAIIFARPLDRFFSENDGHGRGYRLWRLEQKWHERRLAFMATNFRTPGELYAAARWLERVDALLDRESIGTLDERGRKRYGDVCHIVPTTDTKPARIAPGQGPAPERPGPMPRIE